MASKKGGLGRGLGSLFGDSDLLSSQAPIEKPEKANVAKVVPAKTEQKKTGTKKASDSSEKKVSENSKKKSVSEDTSLEQIVYIKLNDIKPNAAQPRKAFNEAALGELADSIKANGVIQPIMVRPSSKGYELVAGERRWRAARLAGLKEIPAIVRILDEKTNALYALIENMQREDLNAIEEANAIQEIIDNYGLTQEETAKVVGKSRPYVSNALRLLKLPKAVQELVENGKLSQGHARAVAGLVGEDVQIDAANLAVKNSWSVRQIENYTAVSPKKKPKKISASNKKKDTETIALEESLSEKIGTKVEIEGSPKSGKIILKYYSSEELDRLLEIFGK